ncbi:hypothetical protein RvY_11176 [Ramazzottius varieornatus]|uniref:Uncharacterized protein n=1 Tax=Ramazzottius varieornatus TaxID=947166 RepID=A0A1D1VKP8_RAMVA|nr:hypothetical protein RvY_11176 [Ramazzottius varieornatus]
MDRKTTCVLLMSKALSYEETVLMLSLPKVERPLRIPFDLNAIDNSDIWEWFHFTRENIPRLKEGFGIPDAVSLENKSLFDGVEILCILLGRLAYPSRYTTLKLIYRRSKPELSMAFSWIVGHVESKFRHLLTSLDLFWLKAADISLFCKAVRRKGAPLRAVWGFIDGTFRPCCRPKVD